MHCARQVLPVSSKGKQITIAGQAQHQSTLEICWAKLRPFLYSPTILALLGRNDAMKKSTRKKASAKRSPLSASTFREGRGARHPKSQQNKASAMLDAGGKLTFNHAMVYVKGVDRGLAFYRDLLGFKLIEDFRYENKPVYARLRAPGGDGTIALHQAGPEVSVFERRCASVFRSP